MIENVTRPEEGVAFVQFGLKLPNTPRLITSAVTVPEMVRMLDSVFEACTTQMSFRVASTDFLDQVLKNVGANGNPLLHLRWGLGNGKQVDWLPWQLHYIVKYQAQYEGAGPAAGHYIALHTADLLHMVDRSSRTRSHRGTISSIVRNIAAQNGLAELVVENTNGEGVWVQSFEGDFTFVRTRLLNRARSTRGRGNYYLFARDNVLHFHTFEYQTEVKDFNYYQSAATRLEAIDLSQAKLSDGAAGVRLTYHDPYTGQPKEIASDPNKSARFANAMPRLNAVAGTERNIREHKIQLRNEEAGPTALAQNAYESARSECFQLKMMTTCTAPLRHGDLIRINIDPGATTTSSWSGLYAVVTAQHVIDKGALNSVYIFQRGEQREARSSTNNLAAYGVETLENQQTAPGHDISVNTAQASTLTRGGARRNDKGVVLTTRSRSEAPVPETKLPS